MKVTVHKKSSRFTLSMSKGFTLVELLIVIAVIGVLAAVILAVINPLQQLARGRDAGRVSTTQQLGSAVQRYFTVNNAYPTLDGNWITTLVTAGEVQNAPTNPTGPGYTSECGTGDSSVAATGSNNICYNANATQAVVYIKAEAGINTSKCTGVGAVAYITWSSAAGREGIVCGTASTGPALGVTTFQP